MATSTLIEPRPKRWTREEFYQMSELGWFQNQHVELIEGEIIEMPIPGNPYCVAMECVAEVLRRVFGPDYWVRAQMPLNFSPHSDPLPDVAPVPGSPRNYADHPTTAPLVVEVSDSSLSFDRKRKASLYALKGIADYWIVNLNERRLEIRRNPVQDPKQDYGYAYADVTVHLPGEHVSTLAVPGVPIAVADLLP